MLPCVSLVVNPCALADARAQAEDTYFQANNWASYDDWRRARDQWDYFCKLLLLVPPALHCSDDGRALVHLLFELCCVVFFPLLFVLVCARLWTRLPVLLCFSLS